MDKALLARVEKQAWFHKYPRGWPFMLFIIVAACTAVSVIAIERAASDRQLYRLDRHATAITTGLQRRSAENIAILKAGAALFGTRGDVSSQVFDEFAQGVYDEEDGHGSRGIGWAEWRQEGGRVQVPVVFFHPANGQNRQVIGYDMFSEPNRRQAMEAAVRLGQPAASGLVQLHQAIGTGKPGFLVYMPVFEPGTGRKRINGFVYSPFEADQFLSSASGIDGVDDERESDVDVMIFDGAASGGRMLTKRALPADARIWTVRKVVIANRSWTVRIGVKRFDRLSTLSRVTLIFGAILALLAMAIARLITKRAADDRQVLEWLSGQAAIRTSLTRELNHRVKNTLANVLSIVALTRRRARNIDDFAESLTGRLRALSATHDLLSQSDWSNAPMGEIVRSELAPYMGESDSHVEMSGPEISLAPNDAMSLGLAIHELATNAAKYGALSVPGGKVFVTWHLPRADVAEVHWREEGGPRVEAPAKRGFGRDLIEKIVSHELQSQVELQFKPEGVECRLQVPVRRLSEFALRGASRPG